MVDMDAPWKGNGTALVTRSCLLHEVTDAQQWFFGPERFHGGVVIRHLRDGRAVDVRGWSVCEDASVGCENSPRDDCDGAAFVFTPAAAARAATAAKGPSDSGAAPSMAAGPEELN